MSSIYDESDFAIEKDDDEADFCPECGSRETIYDHGFTPSGVETSYVVCSKCEHQWGHQ